jgi:hypothetical protein
MNVESIHQTWSRLYRNGAVIVWKQDRPGRSGDEMREIRKIVRTYSVSKIKIQSACIAAWVAKSSEKMLFLTFTFPFEPNEKQAARVWDLMLNSFRNTYKINTYVWIKEKQPQNNDRLHYHIIVDRAWINIRSLQKSYNNALQTIYPDCVKFNNSVRLGRAPVINNVQRISKYLSKYISKTENCFNSKAYGFTDNLKLYRSLDSSDLEKMLIDKSKYIIVVDEPYFMIIILKNFIDTSAY